MKKHIGSTLGSLFDELGVHRLLDPRDTSVTLSTLSKASRALRVELLKLA